MAQQITKRRKAPATRIQRSGKGHRYFLDGEPCYGVTTLLKGIPKGALVGWAAGVVGEHAYDDPEYFDTQRKKLTRAKFLRWVKELRWDVLDEAANRGTEVHALAEQLARGEDVDVPEPIVPHVRSYRDFLDRFRPEVFALEVVVINRTHRYMGRLDHLWWLTALDDDPELSGLRIDDTKTSGSGIFAETAMQQAAYARAETFLVPKDPAHRLQPMLDYAAELGYDPDDLTGETELPMPTVSGTGGLWVRADGADLYPLEYSDAVFRTFLHGAAVARMMELPKWNDNPARSWVGPAVELNE